MVMQVRVPSHPVCRSLVRFSWDDYDSDRFSFDLPTADSEDTEDEDDDIPSADRNPVPIFQDAAREPQNPAPFFPQRVEVGGETDDYVTL